MKKLLFPVACLLASTLFMARCADLTEPVAITPGDRRPVIVTPLNQQLGEDGSLLIDIEAEDPNGEPMTLAVATPPMHGTAVVAGIRTHPAAPTARPASPPAAETPQAILPDDRAAEKGVRQRTNADPSRPSSEQTTTSKQTTSNPAGALSIRAEARLLDGAQRRRVGGAAELVGRIQYTPEADFNGTDRFTFTVRNASGLASEAEVTLTIDAAPDAPKVAGPVADRTLPVGETFVVDLSGVFADPDGDALTFNGASSDPSVATATVGGNVLTVTALNAPSRQATISATATDPGGQNAATSFVVTVTGGPNRDPVVENRIPDRALAIDETFELDLTTVFADPDGDALTFSAQSSNPAIAEAEVVQGSTLRATMRSTGAATITVRADDGKGGATPTSFTVLLEPGVNAVDDEAATDQNTPVDIDVLDNDRDSSNRPLSVVGFLAQPAQGNVAIIEDGGRVRYTPNAGFFGVDRFTYVVSNDQGLLAQAEVVVTVNQTNQPPTLAAPLQDQSLVEGGSSFSADLTAVFSDPEGEMLVFTAQSFNTTVAAVAVQDATLTVTPGAVGNAAISVTATDPGGLSVTDQFNVTVTTSTSTRPVAVDDAYAVDEDNVLAVAAADGVLANDIDIRGGGLTVTLVRNARDGTLALNADGSFTYTPQPDFNGSDQFFYRADDGTEVSDDARVVIQINAVNDAPNTVADNYSVDENDTLVVAATEGVLANDTDAEGDPLTASLASAPTHGTLTFNPDGSFTYTPDLDYTGPDAFTYRANDGVVSSDETTAAITVNQTGNPPPAVTNPGTQTNEEDETASLQIDATDPDTPLTYTSATLPPNLSIDEDTGLISGAIARDAAGSTGSRTYNVEVAVTDRRSGQTTIAFDWEVTNPTPTVTTPPAQNNQEGETASLTIQASDDDPTLTYDDGGTLPPGLSINPSTGQITGTIAVDAAGSMGSMTFSVTITATDPQTGQGSATFDWTVTNPDPTVTNPGDQTHLEDETISLQIDATDDDPALTYAATDLPTGLSIDADTGEITGTIAFDAAGPTGSATYAAEVTVTDDQGGQQSVLFNWDVTNPDPVVTNPGDQTHAEGETISLQIDATDDDPALTYAATDLPTGLSIDANTGEITGVITDDASDNSPYMAEVTVTDDQGGLASTMFTWTVTNPPPVVTNPGDQTSEDGETIPPLQIQATDPDLPLVYAATGLPPSLSIDANTGEISGALDADASANSPYLAEVTVTDDQGAAASVQFNWTVTNPPPQVTDPGNQNDTAGDAVSLQIQAADDDALTYAATGLPPSLSIDANTGEISGVLDLTAGSATPYAVDVTVTDAQSAETTVSFDWSVDHPAPTLTALDPVTGMQGATLDVVLMGTNFIDGVSSVGFSGSGITINTTTVDDATQITVNITIDGMAPPNARDVTVTNAAPGGGTSAAQTFTVTM